MIHLRKYLLPFVALFFSSSLHAQQHFDLWLRGTLGLPFHQQFKVDLEFQHRRQNGFENYNPVHNNLMFSGRVWLHYQKNEQLRFSLVPFSYFSNYKVITSLSDETKNPSSEIRIAAFADSKTPIHEKFHFVTRTGLEYRIFNNNLETLRLRARVGLLYQISNKTGLLISNELLLNVAGVSSNHFFDHNRLGLECEYKITPQFKINAGYLYVVRLPATSDLRLREHDLFINLSYTLKNLGKTRSEK